jgi:hypothetical protein
MQLIPIALAGIIGAIFVAAAVRSAFACKTQPGRKPLAALGYALVAFGGLGFFGLAFSDFGGLRWLPANLEWPVGSVGGALTMPDGTHVVPVVLAGKKLQLYAPDWRFLRGWYVPAGGGGQFRLQLAQTDKIAVITRRNAMQYLYDANGSLISAQTYAPKAFADFPGSRESVRVPTPWWLWMFTSPMHPWLGIASGAVLVLMATRGAKGESHGAQHSAPPNGGPTIRSGNSGAGGGSPSVR